MKIELIPRSGWILVVTADEWKQIGICNECGLKIKSKDGFYCKRAKRMIHRECEEKSNHNRCRGSDIEHEHFNIINVEIEK